MTESHYEELITKSLERFRDLYQKREEIDVELVKLRQFIYATVNMVPDKDREKWTTKIERTVQKFTASSVSLAESVRRVFEDHPNLITAATSKHAA